MNGRNKVCAQWRVGGHQAAGESPTPTHTPALPGVYGVRDTTAGGRGHTVGEGPTVGAVGAPDGRPPRTGPNTWDRHKILEDIRLTLEVIGKSQTGKGRKKSQGCISTSTKSKPTTDAGHQAGPEERKNKYIELPSSADPQESHRRTLLEGPDVSTKSYINYTVEKDQYCKEKMEKKDKAPRNNTIWKPGKHGNINYGGGRDQKPSKYTTGRDHSPAHYYAKESCRTQHTTRAIDYSSHGYSGERNRNEGYSEEGYLRPKFQDIKRHPTRFQEFSTIKSRRMNECATEKSQSYQDYATGRDPRFQAYSTGWDQGYPKYSIVEDSRSREYVRGREECRPGQYSLDRDDGSHHRVRREHRSEESTVGRDRSYPGVTHVRDQVITPTYGYRQVLPTVVGPSSVRTGGDSSVRNPGVTSHSAESNTHKFPANNKQKGTEQTQRNNDNHTVDRTQYYFKSEKHPVMRQINASCQNKGIPINSQSQDRHDSIRTHKSQLVVENKKNKLKTSRQQPAPAIPDSSNYITEEPQVSKKNNSKIKEKPKVCKNKQEISCKQENHASSIKTISETPLEVSPVPLLPTVNPPTNDGHTVEGEVSPNSTADCDSEQKIKILPEEVRFASTDIRYRKGFFESKSKSASSTVKINSTKRRSLPSTKTSNNSELKSVKPLASSQSQIKPTLDQLVCMDDNSNKTSGFTMEMQDEEAEKSRTDDLLWNKCDMESSTVDSEIETSRFIEESADKDGEIEQESVRKVGKICDSLKMPPVSITEGLLRETSSCEMFDVRPDDTRVSDQEHEKVPLAMVLLPQEEGTTDIQTLSRESSSLCSVEKPDPSTYSTIQMDTTEVTNLELDHKVSKSEVAVCSKDSGVAEDGLLCPVVNVMNESVKHEEFLSGNKLDDVSQDAEGNVGGLVPKSNESCNSLSFPSSSMCLTISGMDSSQDKSGGDLSNVKMAADTLDKSITEAPVTCQAIKSIQDRVSDTCKSKTQTPTISSDHIKNVCSVEENVIKHSHEITGSSVESKVSKGKNETEPLDPAILCLGPCSLSRSNDIVKNIDKKVCETSKESHSVVTDNEPITVEAHKRTPSFIKPKIGHSVHDFLWKALGVVSEKNFEMSEEKNNVEDESFGQINSDVSVDNRDEGKDVKNLVEEPIIVNGGNLEGNIECQNNVIKAQTYSEELSNSGSDRILSESSENDIEGRVRKENADYSENKYDCCCHENNTPITLGKIHSYPEGFFIESGFASEVPLHRGSRDKFVNILKSFIDSNLTEYNFSPLLDPYERRFVHELASYFGLLHKCHGHGLDTFLVVTKKNTQLEEQVMETETGKQSTSSNLKLSETVHTSKLLDSNLNKAAVKEAVQGIGATNEREHHSTGSSAGHPGSQQLERRRHDDTNPHRNLSPEEINRLRKEFEKSALIFPDIEEPRMKVDDNEDLTESDERSGEEVNKEKEAENEEGKGKIEKEISEISEGIEGKSKDMESGVKQDEVAMCPDPATGYFTLCFMDINRLRYRATVNYFHSYSQEEPIVTRGPGQDEVRVSFKDITSAQAALTSGLASGKFPSLHVVTQCLE